VLHGLKDIEKNEVVFLFGDNMHVICVCCCLAAKKIRQEN
jgi:hypothetical protein